MVNDDHLCFVHPTAEEEPDPLMRLLAREMGGALEHYARNVVTPVQEITGHRFTEEELRSMLEPRQS